MGPDTFRLCPGVGLSSGGGQGAQRPSRVGLAGQGLLPCGGKVLWSLALGVEGTRLHTEVHGKGLSRGGAAAWKEPLLFFGEADRLQVSLIWEATHGRRGRAEL